MIKRYFAISWPEELEPEWMNVGKVASFVFGSVPAGKHIVGVKVEDVTDSFVEPEGDDKEKES